MLVSDDRLGYSVQTLTKLYARRMTLEELFRDAKNRRYGWAYATRSSLLWVG